MKLIKVLATTFILFGVLLINNFYAVEPCTGCGQKPCICRTDV